MSLVDRLDSKSHKLYLEAFPQTPISYSDVAPSDTTSAVKLEVSEGETDQKKVVFLNSQELQDMGVSVSVWNKLSLLQLPSMLRETSHVLQMLNNGGAFALTNISRGYSRKLQQNSRLITQLAISALCDGDRYIHQKGLVRALFKERAPSEGLFLNIPGSTFGQGAFGIVKKALFLQMHDTSIVAAKVFRQRTEKAFTSELYALREFSEKPGIIHLIAGGIYERKIGANVEKIRILFLPLYQSDLNKYLLMRPSVPVVERDLGIAIQLLEGLLHIAKKGVHGDIATKNILLKNNSATKQVEAVIADFGSYRAYGKEKAGISTILYLPPEYCEKQLITTKQDVWALGLVFLSIFSYSTPAPINCLDLDEVYNCVTKLKVHWSLDHTIRPQYPAFVRHVIDKMLDPRHEHRLTAEDAFSEFSIGLKAFMNQCKIADALYALAVGSFF